LSALLRVACGELDARSCGLEIQLCGWVNSSRDHGGLLFIDVRDALGITQTVFDPGAAPAAAQTAATLRSEDVVAVSGTVRRRPPGTENKKLATGEIEVAAAALEVLNRSLTPPFPVHSAAEIDEALRLKYRYIDLRRPHMQRNLQLRHRAVKAVRDYLDSERFLEIETPLLIKQTPEGARDFIVPSRLHAGQFYALPQSPQLFKQLLMVSGFARYFQIARCLRDEDARADRQPEFTQIDLEMAFAQQQDVIAVTEGLLRSMFAGSLGVDVKTPFPRLSHRDALLRYGSDKPDLRFGLDLLDFSAAFAGTPFRVFTAALERGQQIVGFCDPGGASRSRREFDALGTAAAELGAQGLVWIALAADGVRSPLPKAALSAALLDEIRRLTAARTGDALFLLADEPGKVRDLAGRLRLHVAQTQNLRDPASFAFCWVLDFPLFERLDNGRLGPMHHPFTAPATGQEALEGDALALRAQHYDVVLNGAELGSGSIRIHDPALQRKIFARLGYSDAQIDERFGFLLEALSYGAPPHGGIALGVDRIIQLMIGAPSIREVIAFPKNQRFQDLMIQAPSAVAPEVLAELQLKLSPAAQAAASGGDK
jgi:aspartyl-tRNA synthetase